MAVAFRGSVVNDELARRALELRGPGYPLPEVIAALEGKT
jgi:hypothetical protein